MPAGLIAMTPSRFRLRSLGREAPSPCRSRSPIARSAGEGAADPLDARGADRDDVHADALNVRHLLQAAAPQAARGAKQELLLPPRHAGEARDDRVFATHLHLDDDDEVVSLRDEIDL